MKPGLLRPKTRHGVRSGADASIFLLVVILLFLAGGIVVAFFALRSDPVEEALSNDQVIRVLYIIEKDQKPLCTYALMCYPNTRRAVIFDIPGELGMLIKRINRVDRIDTVYEPGKITNYISEIESLLGVEIAFSMVMNIENLGKMVDLIEGVELFIPSQVQLLGETPVLFPSGISRLDGDKAKLFISYKSPEEDQEMPVFRRQRFFLGLLKRQTEINETLKNPAVSQMFGTFIQTNLNQRARTRLLNELSVMDLDRTGIQSVGGNLREVSNQILLIPYYDGNLVKDIVRQVLGTLTRTADSPLSDRVFTVEVLNGTAVNGLAGRTAEVLRGFGYDIISIGNADHSGYEKTMIMDRSGIEGMAKTFADIIHCNNIRQETPVRENSDSDLPIQSYEYRSDFTLVIGRDFNGRYVSGN